MVRKGYSPTTILIVIVLIGALFMVSKRVNPPPPGPPAPVQKVAEIPKRSKQDEMKQRKMMMQKMHEDETMRKNAPKQPTKPIVNPTAVDVSSGYWKNHDMGVEGTKKEDIEIAQEKVEFDKHIKQTTKPVVAPPAEH